MKAKINSRDEQYSQRDLIKWLLALILLVVGIGANYYWHNVVWSLRFALGIVLVCVMLGLIAGTKKGKIAWRFAREARAEMRKVVWPVRKETFQVAVMIVIVVIIMAMILWCADSILMWIVSKLTS